MKRTALIALLIAAATLSTFESAASARGRYVDPNLGRFIQPDPLDYVDGNSRYADRKNNPVNKLDPSGSIVLGGSSRGAPPFVELANGEKVYVLIHRNKAYRVQALINPTDLRAWRLKQQYHHSISDRVCNELSAKLRAWNPGHTAAAAATREYYRHSGRTLKQPREPRALWMPIGPADPVLKRLYDRSQSNQWIPDVVKAQILKEMRAATAAGIPKIMGFRDANDIAALQQRSTGQAIVDGVGEGIATVASGKVIGRFLKGSGALLRRLKDRRVLNKLADEFVEEINEKLVKSGRSPLNKRQISQLRSQFISNAEKIARRAELTRKLVQRTKGRGGVWSQRPLQRGVDIEARLAKTEYADWFHVGKTHRGKFPLVDFQKGNTLVSLKTVDTTGKTWMNRMKEHIVDLGTRGAAVNGKRANMMLDIRVQPGGAKAAKSLVKLGRQYSVKVIIKEFP
jgi:hypothetical protein